MATIYIGNEHSKTFDSIVKLYEKGRVEAGVITAVNGDTIITPSHEFVLTRSAASATNVERAVAINSKGATWFGVFRGEKFKNDTAEWLTFVERVKDYFHRNYSVLEYRPRNQILSDSDIEKQKDMIADILKPFYKNYRFSIFSAGDNDEDVYGATFRMEITDGTGEAVPVLGKLYFHKENPTIQNSPFIPYGRDEAEMINQSILDSDNFGKEEKGNSNKQNSATLTDKVVNEIDKLINRKAGYDISSNIVFSDDRDKAAVEQMVSRGPNDVVALTCVSMSLLNIFHFKWKIDAYDVLIEDKLAFKASVSFGGRITVRCNSCADKSVLIDSNKVAYENEEGEEKTLTLKLGEENLGLENEDLEEANYYVFSNHMRKIECKKVLTNGCKKYVCKNNMAIVTDAKGVNHLKCSNCPHVEMLFKCSDGKVRFTKELVFVRDDMTLMPKEDTVVCGCCGRTYVWRNKKVKHYTCEFCKNADKVDEQKGKALYSKYKNMLSLTTRLGSIKKNKYCIEDEDIIMFIIGDKKYIFDKDMQAEGGFLKSPRTQGGNK